MLCRLREIREYLGGRMPSYSEIYKSETLRKKFNSCSLAGAIYRFNQRNGITSYGDFVGCYLGWEIHPRLNKERTQQLFERIVHEFGGMPRGVGKIGNLFGHKGHTFEEAFKKFYGMTIKQYCEAHGVQRVGRQGCDFGALQSCLRQLSSVPNGSDC